MLTCTGPNWGNSADINRILPSAVCFFPPFSLPSLLLSLRKWIISPKEFPHYRLVNVVNRQLKLELQRASQRAALAAVDSSVPAAPVLGVGPALDTAEDPCPSVQSWEPARSQTEPPALNSAAPPETGTLGWHADSFCLAFGADGTGRINIRSQLWQEQLRIPGESTWPRGVAVWD
ncbi:vasoactive intestinal polypeptide receptor 2 [Platysternon megacephalum]|uniref:Vasoactive intestinal polypeptide receptor 2 n=1 Tax=Platysternon megacephalum TaxID=55544 RepID=A0A4D9ENH1_9SAUR|nr:vasoactive intestinal polypeptide receptor 2 [Platysternon megacephalum]